MNISGISTGAIALVAIILFATLQWPKLSPSKVTLEVRSPAIAY